MCSKNTYICAVFQSDKTFADVSAVMGERLSHDDLDSTGENIRDTRAEKFPSFF